MNTNPISARRARPWLALTFVLSALTSFVSAQTNADLSSLVPSAGTLDPVFASGTISYTATVPFATTSMTVTPTVVEAGATITVNTIAVVSGNASDPIALSVGANVITTEVTSQDTSTTKTYTVTVTRGAASTIADLSNLVPSAGTLDPVFASGTIAYTATVPFATGNMTVTPTTANSLATVTVNGNPETSGSPSGTIALSVGPNIITTVVTAEDTVTTKTYTLTVTREAASTIADLSNLVPSAGTLDPVFDSGTISYTATVPFATGSMTVTPTTADSLATVTVNGNPATSGSPSGSITLSVGVNVITIDVTAEDTVTTLTYTLTVTRTAASTNADLSNLVPSIGTLNPVFDTGTISYTASVPYPNPSMTVTPTKADPLSAIKVNGITVVSGNPSAPISLSPGANVITTVVTAEDASTKTYTLTVNVTVADPVAIPGGPYTVFAGGTLVLNGSPSLPSDGNTITSYEWDLDDDGDYDEAITGATPAAIPEGTLTTTYGMSLGGNTIRLKVTDSAAETSVTEATVNILPAVPVVYEPFNYPGTALNGQSGSSEVGLTGTWTANAASFLGPNRDFGPLVTRGAGIGDLQTGVNRFGGARAVSASALAANGLLTDGATLWFSVIMGYDIGGNVTNSRLAMCLATEGLSPNNFAYFFPTAGAEGLGVTLGNLSGNGRVAATKFRDSTFGSGVTGNQLGTLSSVLYGAGQSGLIVGKITWGTGGGNDTIEIYNPGVNLALPGTPISTLSIAVNQTNFDTITWSRGDRVVMDEIRFGGSYQAVIETGSAWDLNGNVAGAGSATPSGTWNADAIWNLASDGTLVPIPWQAGGVATFSAGTDATGAYSVTVDGTQDIGGLLFEDGMVTVSGGTALRMTANTTVSVGTGLTATIDTPFTQDATSRQLAKAGAGTLVLSGNNVAATGGMNLSAGVARFESPSSINGTARDVTIGSGGTMMFGSGFGVGNIPTALLGRVAASSAGAIATDNYATTNFDFNTAGLTAARLGAVGNVNYTGTLTQNGTTYRLGGGGGTLTMANTNALTGANSLVITGNVTLAGNNDYTGTTTINASSIVTILGSSTTSAVTLNTPNTTLLVGNAASLGVGTLTVANSFAGPGTLGAIGTVVTTNPVTAGTDFNFGGTGALTIGTVTVGAGRTITNNNTTNVSTITSITSTAASALTFAGNGSTTVAGAIGGGSGITNIAKSGSGTLTLNGVNTHTGTTGVSAGTLKLGAGSLPNTAISVTGTGTFAVQPGSATPLSAGNNLTAAAGASLNLGGRIFSMVDGFASTFNLVQGASFATALTVTNGAIFQMNLGTAGTDQLAVTRNAAVTGTVNVTLDTTGAASLTPGTYNLITAATGLTSGPPTWQFTGGGTTRYVTVGSSFYKLTLAAAPSAVSVTVALDGYEAWANANAPGQTIDQDHDGDGVPNGVEYFMGLSGNGFTSNPAPNASNLVSWPKGASYAGTYGTHYAIQISSDLGATDPWTNVPQADVTIDGDSVDYDLDTLPVGVSKFARLKVTGP